MKINGYGEFNQLRRLVQKDDEKTSGKAAKKAAAESQTAPENGDAVQISPEARMRGKLRSMPEVREAVVARVKAKMDAGTLVTDESIRSGSRKMLESLLGDGM